MHTLLAGLQRNADQHIGCLAPILSAFVDLSQMLADARHLLLERDDARLNFVQCEMRNALGGLVGQTAQLVANVSQDLARDDETDMFVDD